MSRLRISVTAKLAVLSPLHVGSGEGRHVDAVDLAASRNGRQNIQPDVAAIQRDANGQPWIPGSTLKGLLRRLADQPQTDRRAWTTRLLGCPPDDAGKTARMGALLVYGATLAQPGDATGMPYSDVNPPPVQGPAQSGMLGRGVYVAARTAIDSSLGIAANGKLFFQEVVAPGAQFTLRLLLDLHAPVAEHAAARQQLLTLLSRMTGAEGVQIGAGQADGQGRIRLLAATLQLQEGRLDTKGFIALKPSKPSLAAPSIGTGSHRRWVLNLNCPGPFAVLDGSYPVRRAEGQPQLQAQRQTKGSLPIIPGASLMGTLRSHAAWIASLDAHRAKQDTRQDDQGKVYRDEVRTPLTAVERLFGVAGYRALLGLASFDVTAAKPWSVHSVRLDRFSGGPIDNALFETSCFTGVAARAVIELAARPMSAAALTSAEKLAEELMKQLGAQGLRLGHGTNRGFGWFDVTVTQEAVRAAF
ncbi:MAG: RAMP superfamily CRISPR-associated protein [Novosphingobium sp.]|nr:RAMP superfamily CRISPR-associated protein [Novosphingobium sp.]